jgi:hypothetical protein
MLGVNEVHKLKGGWESIRYYYNGTSKFHMRIEYGLDGTWTTIRDGDVINSANLNPSPKATDWAGFWPASVSICQHLSTFVSFCQLLSTFVNICQHLIDSICQCTSFCQILPTDVGRGGCQYVGTGSHLVVVVMVVMVVWCGVVLCRADLATKLSTRQSPNFQLSSLPPN